MAADARRDRGRLAIVTTHLHARSTLLDPVCNFVARYPDVKLQLVESEPDSIPRLLESNEADIGVSTESERSHPARRKHIDLAAISRYPLLGYHPTSRTGQIITGAFHAHGIRPRFLMSVGDSDVIKAYVAQGLGIAVLPALALDSKVDTRLDARDVTALFPTSTITVSFRRNAYLRRYVIDFIATIPGLSPEEIAALRQPAALMTVP
jgi:LysR family cys regulon transcriptional activator